MSENFILLIQQRYLSEKFELRSAKFAPLIFVNFLSRKDLSEKDEFINTEKINT